MSTIKKNSRLVIGDTTVSTSTSTGALVVAGGVGLGGVLNATSGAFTGALSASTITGTLQTASQPNVTSTGTLTSLTVSGVTSITNNTTATNNTNGALRVAGSITTQNSLYSPFYYLNDGTGNMYSWRHVNNNFETGTTIDNSTAGATLVRLNIASSSASGSYTSRLMIYALGLNTLSDQERVVLEANSTKAMLYWSATGTGVNRPLEVWGATTFNTDGTISHSNTTDATAGSTTTGALTLTGGLSVAKRLNVGTNLHVLGSLFGLSGVLTISDAVTVGSATASTSTSTGALVVTGGIGIGGALNGTTGTFTGTLTATTLVGTLQTASQPNVTSLGTLTSLTVSGATTLTAGTASGTTSTGTLVVTGGIGVSGQVTASTLAGTLQTSSQPNITSVGALTALTVSGATTLTADVASTTTATGTLIVTGGIGVSGQVTATSLSGTLQTASQPNVTSLGTLTSLTVSGATSLTADTASTTTATGTLIVTGGIGVSGQVTASTLAGTIQTSSQPNITSLGTLTSLTVSGATSLTAGTASTTTSTGTLIVTGGIGVSGQITASTVSATSLVGTLQTASQPNITSLGTLTSLTVSGATSLTAGTASTSTSTGSLVVTGGIGVSGQVTASTLAGTLQTASQPNITSLGTLTSLTVSGATSLTAGTASTTTSTGTLVVTGGIGVSGQVTASTIAGTLQTSAQPNITSVGTLTSLTVSGAISGSTLTGTLQTASQPNITSTGTLTSLTVSGTSSFTNTTDASATNSGSVIFAGGVGIAKRLFLGSDITFPTTGNIGLNTVDQSDTGSVSIYASSVPLSTRGAFIQLFGQQHSTNPGELILSSTTIAGSIKMETAGVTRVTVSLAGNVAVSNNTASTSTSTGALTVNGGVGIGGSLYVGGTIYQNGVAVGTGGGGTTYTAGTNIDITGNTISVVNNPTFSGAVSITNNTSATNTTTGALTVTGGIGVGRSLHIGTGIFGFQAPVTASPPTTSGAIFSIGGSTYTNGATASGGTHSFYSHGFIGAPTLAASNTNVTTTEAYSFYIPGPPTAGTNMTLTQRFGLGVSGNGTNVAGSYPVIISNSNQGSYTPTLLLENALGNEGAAVGIDMVTYGGGRDYPSGSIRMIDMLEYNGDMSFHTRNANNVLTTNMEERMRITAGGTLRLFRNAIAQVPLTTGNIIDVPAGTFTNRGTAASGTATNWFGTFLGVTTLSATNTNVTTPIAATLNIEGAPVAGTNNTITTPRALRVASGITELGGQVLMTANISSNTTTTGTLVVTGGIGASGQITSTDVFATTVGGTRLYTSITSSSPPVFPNVGLRLSISSGATLTNTNTPGSGTISNMNIAYIGRTTYAASNTNVTVTNANTLLIENVPLAGTNITITNAYALNVQAGRSIFQGNVASTTTDSGTIIVVGGIGVSGQVTATSLAGTLQTSAQPNITSIGTLSGLTVSSTNAISLTASLATNSVQINNANTAGSAAFQLTNDNSSSFLGYGGSAHGNALYRNTLFFQSFSGMIFRTNNEAVTALTIASDGTWTSPSLINFTNTTEATATNTSSVNFAGGIAVAKRLFIGGDIVYQSTGKIVTNTVDESDNGMIGISGGGDAQPTRGAFIQLFGQQHGTNPGQLILGSTTITGSIILQSAGVNRMTVNLAGDVSVLNNTASNSTSTGALIVTGGVGVGGRVSASNMTTGTLTASGATTLTAGTASTTTATGTLIVTGGIGVSGQVTANALSSTTLTASGATTLTAGTASTTTNSGTLVVTGGIGVSGQVTANALSSTTLTASGSTTLTAGTASTSTNTGTLIVTGGVGMSGSLNVGNAIIGYRSSVTATPPTTSGSAFSIGGNTYTNTIAASGTQTAYYHGFIGAPTLAASNTNVTTTEAYSCFISGPPTAGTNMSVTSRYGLGVSGNGANTAGSYPVVITNSNSGAYTPTLLLENSLGNLGAAVGIDMVTYGGGRDYPSGSIRMIDMLDYNGDMSFHTRNANNVLTTNMEERMRITAGGTLRLFRNAIAQVPLTTGNIIDVPAGTFTNRGTAASGTATNWFGTFLGITTVATLNTGVTTPVAATLHIDGAPVAGTNNTITNAFALNVASGRVQLAGNVASTTTATGTLLVTGGIGVSGQVTATNLAGTLQTASQPNITSVGTLTGLTVTTGTQPVITTSFADNAIRVVATSTSGTAGFALANDASTTSFLGYGGSAHGTTVYRNTLFFQSANGLIFRTNSNVTALTIATDTTWTTPSIVNFTNTTEATTTANGAIRLSGGLSVAKTIVAPAISVTTAVNTAGVTINGNGTTTAGIFPLLVTNGGGTGEYRPTIMLENTNGGTGSSVGIDFVSYGGSRDKPAGALRFIDAGLFTGDLVYSSKLSGNITNEIAERLRITWSGGLRLFRTNSTGIPLTAGGNMLDIRSGTFTDDATASGTSAPDWSTAYVGTTTVASSATNVTVPTASALFIQGAPVAGTNTTITNSFALNIAGGRTIMSGNISSTTTATGTLIVTGGIGVSGQVTATNLAGTLQTASQPNITSVGTLTGLTVSTSSPISLTSSLGNNAVQLSNTTTEGSASFQLTNDNSSSYVGYGGSAHVNPLYRNALFFQSFNGMIFRTNNEAVTALTIATDGSLSTPSILTMTNNTSATNNTNGALRVTGSITTTTNTYSPAFIINDGTANMYSWRHVAGFGTGTTIDNITSGATIVRLNVASSTATGNYTGQLQVYTLGLNGNANQERLVLEANSTKGMLYWLTAGTGVVRPLEIWGATTFNTDGTVSLSTTTESTSTTTGALRVAGGLAVGRTLVATAISSVTANITATTDSSTPTTGALVVAGGIASTGRLTIRNGTNVPQIRIAHATTGNEASIGFFRNNNYTETVAGDMWVVGHNLFGSGSGTFAIYTTGTGNVLTSSSTGIISILNTTDSTNTSTGALRVSGGLAISKTLSIGGEIINMVGPTARIKMTGTSNDIWIGAQINDGAGDWHVYDITSNRRVMGYYRSNNNLALGSGGTGLVSVDGTNDSSNSTNGALLVYGGIGVAKSVSIGGTLRKATGTFDIAHPQPSKKAQGYRLRHGFVESPTGGDNIYRYQQDSTNGTITITLPEYYAYLNKDSQVFITAVNVMGYGMGRVEVDPTTNIAVVHCRVSTNGLYNVLIIGTRKDEDVQKYWEQTYEGNPEYIPSSHQ